jgi:hypothetical protein
MQSKSHYETALVQLWRERMRRFELAELMRNFLQRRKASASAPPSRAEKTDRAKELIDA